MSAFQEPVVTLVPSHALASEQAVVVTITHASSVIAAIASTTATPSPSWRPLQFTTPPPRKQRCLPSSFTALLQCTDDNDDEGASEQPDVALATGGDCVESGDGEDRSYDLELEIEEDDPWTPISLYSGEGGQRNFV